MRGAIRYFEFKSAGKLPKNVSFDCAECVEKGLQDKRNCEGEGNPNYRMKIGSMEYDVCPFSLCNQETVDVIELILTQEETGIPISGTDLLSQTRKMFEYRRYIMDEKAQSIKEISDIEKKEQERKEREKKSASRATRAPRGPRRTK